jgi:hypothetical protein
VLARRLQIPHELISRGVPRGAGRQALIPFSFYIDHQLPIRFDEEVDMRPSFKAPPLEPRSVDTTAV